MNKVRKATLVELRNVRLTLGGKPVLRGVSWKIQRGDGWLVTGPNGAGKTSLLRMVAGRIWPDSGPQGGQRIYYFDKPPTDSPIGLEGRLAWLSPETHQRFARLGSPLSAGDTILTGFANTLLLTHRPTAAQRIIAKKLASKLNLSHLWLSPFAELSQGQQRLVLLARVLVVKPKLLILDEFSDGLDRTTRRLVGAAIRQRLRVGAAIIVATHRMSDVLPGLTRHLRVRKGNAGEIPILKEARESKSKTRKSMGKQTLATAAAPILEFHRASVSVGDHARVKRILHNINWMVSSGEHWAVLGSNGSGKSTLLRAIYGELPVARGGTLKRFGRNETDLPLPKARRLIGFVSPALHHHYAADLSVAEVVASGFQSTIGLLKVPSGRELMAARKSLHGLGIGKLAAREWGALSFGEARLVLLARALAPRPKLLLLDEPCDGLSPLARQRFLQAVERAARTGAQVIATAHHAQDLPVCINRKLHLHNGRVI